MEEQSMSIPATKEEIVSRLKELAQDAANVSRQELEALKQAYYKQVSHDNQEAMRAYLDAGGDPEAYTPAAEPTEPEFKAQMALIKEQRTALFLAQEEEKQANLAAKQALIEKVKELAALTPEEAGSRFNEFKDLQTQWREIGGVPAENANEIWKTYQLYSEQFYDLIGLNHEMRELDFKKNLEQKTQLCEQAEKLSEEEDVLSAFRQLQTLHLEWREVGPVVKELRDDIWNRFKAASTVINKRHQQHFDAIKAREEENLTQKQALCEQLEALDHTTLTTSAAWAEATKTVLELQAAWKTIGFAPQKMNAQIFERFRGACDNFFKAKNEFFAQLKSTYEANLAHKTALVEKAEALKDSTDWRATSDALIALQKEWKTVGALPHKVSDELWKRFSTACDAFFNAKNEAAKPQRAEEAENLGKKKDVIERLKALLEESGEEAQQKVRDLMAEWNEVGHVPFRDKDKVYKAYHEVVDKLFKQLNMTAAQRRLDSFKSNLRERVEKGGESNLSRERERMFRAFEAMKNEIKTYENNIGFLTSSSKKGNTLVTEMNKKMDKLKEELELLRKKIVAMDEEIKNQQ